MEPEEYIEYFKDTILSRTPRLSKGGVMQRSRHLCELNVCQIAQVVQRSRLMALH